MSKNKDFVSEVLWFAITSIAFIASMICMYTEVMDYFIVFQTMFWAGLLMNRIIDVQTQLNEIERKLEER